MTEMPADVREACAGFSVLVPRSELGLQFVPPELLDDTESLTEWYDRAWEWIGSLKPKPTKK